LKVNENVISSSNKHLSASPDRYLADITRYSQPLINNNTNACYKTEFDSRSTTLNSSQSSSQNCANGFKIEMENSISNETLSHSPVFVEHMNENENPVPFITSKSNSQLFDTVDVIESTPLSEHHLVHKETSDEKSIETQEDEIFVGCESKEDAKEYLLKLGYTDHHLNILEAFSNSYLQRLRAIESLKEAKVTDAQIKESSFYDIFKNIE
jgi:hypothetical protein